MPLTRTTSGLVASYNLQTDQRSSFVQRRNAGGTSTYDATNKTWNYQHAASPGASAIYSADAASSQTDVCIQMLARFDGQEGVNNVDHHHIMLDMRAASVTSVNLYYFNSSVASGLGHQGNTTSVLYLQRASSTGTLTTLVLDQWTTNTIVIGERWFHKTRVHGSSYASYACKDDGTKARSVTATDTTLTSGYVGFALYETENKAQSLKKISHIIVTKSNLVTVTGIQSGYQVIATDNFGINQSASATATGTTVTLDLAGVMMDPDTGVTLTIKDTGGATLATTSGVFGGDTWAYSPESGTPVTLTTQLRYAIAATYSQAKDLAYRIATQSSLSKPLQYAIGVAQTLTKQARYAVAAGVSQTKELTYRVAAQAGAIQKSARYAVASAYAQTKNLTYRILTQSSIAKQARYAIQTAATVAKSVTYRVSSSAVVQKTLQYVVYAAGTGTIIKSFAYRVATQAAAITKQARYAIASTASIAKSLTYRIGSSAAVQKALRYAIAAAQAGAIVKDLIYRVATQSTIAKSLAYVVQSLEQMVIAKSLAYAVGLERAIARTMRYAIVGEQRPRPMKVFISRSARLLRGRQRRSYRPGR